MSASFLKSLVSGGMTTLSGRVDNGTFRLKRIVSSTATDDQGFPSPTRNTPEASFLPCSWSIESEKTDAREEIIGAQPKGILKYVVMIRKTIGSTNIEPRVDDTLELKRDPAGSAVELHITAVIDQSGAAWAVYATDVNAT